MSIDVNEKVPEPVSKADGFPSKLWASQTLLGGWMADEHESKGKVPYVPESTLRRYREALERIADPRLRHKEPDNYTELGCVMNIAAEALRETGENRDMERLGKDASE